MIETKMKSIVIVGAGFGGMQTALGLAKKFRRRRDVSITLADRRDYHLFSPNLYEVATAEEELVSLGQLKKNIAIPIKEIISGTGINFIKGQLTAVDPRRNTVVFGQQEVQYDFLVLALGGAPDFSSVRGAPGRAMGLKNFPDALRIRNALEFMVQAHRFNLSKANLNVVVAGGGYIGVELAGELPGFLDFVAWKNGYPREKIKIILLEAGSRLLYGLGEQAAADAYFRLKDLGVRVEFYKRLAEVSDHTLEFFNGERLAYDVLIWAAGVRGQAVPMAKDAPVKFNSKGCIEVNQYLQIPGFENIFAIGDLAVLGASQPAQPATAQSAISQAKFLAGALPVLMQNRRPEGYQSRSQGFIVSIGGKWAILTVGKLYVTGFWAYVADLLAHWNYYRSLVGVWKAWRYVFTEARIYSRNDD